ncbi:MAG TPA: nitrile hydratase subunit alpha [Dehalococcoidia bacterium]|nr:nitrile hydratase subunit alpha [Dehalococcoidia bacterium]MDP6273224.1 nitrile hydratase subunit alpha [Dehalococcoidia bacterium]MDP7161336.1 nitrile hydratase subunit alpha [Dehalococcoidia bacterium]MDP7212239.1 nitrile hydratase subunit alpha [Dehalococcoidia bacterium]MDP7515409.1 nitrile hydratase subunit alpha [Dehalococcoidia bacterium]
MLGPPPDWYKSFSYRSGAVTEPRVVMSEFGLELGGTRPRSGLSTATLSYDS